MALSGTPEFIEQLLKKRFLSAKKKVLIMEGVDVNEQFFIDSGFDHPVLIPSKEGLRLQAPPTTFTLVDVANCVGRDLEVDVIDVRAQDEVKMKMNEFLKYFYEPTRSRLLNVLSLEFSRTRLSEHVSPPHVVSELSLVEKCWPPEDGDEEEEMEDGTAPGTGVSQVRLRPAVQKYCLMSMSGSYTDFHIDFGGSSVWYHLLWGEKIFYLIPPTRENSRCFWEWFARNDHRSVFFPDLLPSSSLVRKRPEPGCEEGEVCRMCPVYKLRIKTGETILLPSGWIHAVYTPTDTLVFGGNFLTTLSIPLQLEVYRREQKLKTEARFMFPFFEKLHWFVAELILNKLKSALENGRVPLIYYVLGGKVLVKTLSKWYDKRKQLDPYERCHYLPDLTTLEMPCPKLIGQLRDVLLALEARHLIELGHTGEDYRRSSAPAALVPGGERGSSILASDKRQKKKTGHRGQSMRQSDSGDEAGRPPSLTAVSPGSVSSVSSSSSTTTQTSGSSPTKRQRPTREEEEAEAIPEIKDAKLVGDHYMFRLSDSEEDSGVGRKRKRKKKMRVPGTKAEGGDGVGIHVKLATAGLAGSPSLAEDPSWTAPAKPHPGRPRSATSRASPSKSPQDKKSSSPHLLLPTPSPSTSLLMHSRTAGSSGISGAGVTLGQAMTRIAGRDLSTLPSAATAVVKKRPAKNEATAKQRLAKKLGIKLF